jgi:uncharacterized membrane protein
VTAPQDEPQAHRPAGAPGDATGRTASEPGRAAEAEQAVEAEADARYTERFIAFSDAVVAIAITLLALALAAPVGAAGWTNGQLLHALGRQWTDYLAFLVSFLVIGNHWAAHRRVFRYAGSISQVIGLLNLLWLLMVVLIPFAAKLLAGHGAFGVRFAIYTMIQVIATGCLLLMSVELRRGRMLRPGAPSRAYHPDSAPFLAICITFLISIPVAFVTSWAYAVWTAIPLAVRVLRRFHGDPAARHAGRRRAARAAATSGAADADSRE